MDGNDKSKSVERLSRLLLNGRVLFKRHFPDYKPRETDEDHFDLYIKSGVNPSRSHNKWFERWADEVHRTLMDEIGDDYYLERFISTKYPENITLLAPDGYYYFLDSLQSIVGELKRIELAKKEIKYKDDSEKYTAYYDYYAPCLVIHFEELGSSYIVHRFRAGKPKQIIEKALSSPDNTVRSSELRAGSISGITISGSFTEILKQLIERDDVPIHRFLVAVSPSKLAVSREPFVLHRKDYKSIVHNLKKFE